MLWHGDLPWGKRFIEQKRQVKGGGGLKNEFSVGPDLLRTKPFILYTFSTMTGSRGRVNQAA